MYFNLMQLLLGFITSFQFLRLTNNFCCSIWCYSFAVFRSLAEGSKKFTEIFERRFVSRRIWISLQILIRPSSSRRDCCKNWIVVIHSILHLIISHDHVLFQNFDSLEHRTVSSEKSDDSLVDCVQSALSDLYAAADENDEAMQLCELLSSPHMRALQEAFDDIAQKRFYPVIPLPPAHTVTEEAVGTLGKKASIS